MEEEEIGVIIEVKYPDGGDLEAGCKEALEQIEKKNYEAALVARGVQRERIRQYGFGFCGKRVLIGR